MFFSNAMLQDHQYLIAVKYSGNGALHEVQFNCNSGHLNYQLIRNQETHKMQRGRWQIIFDYSSYIKKNI